MASAGFSALTPGTRAELKKEATPDHTFVLANSGFEASKPDLEGTSTLYRISKYVFKSILDISCLLYYLLLIFSTASVQWF
jgi:hypothetical protein